MQLKDFNYNLPKELIAQTPTSLRDHSRLLVLNKKTGSIQHKKFFNIIDFLNKGDVLLLNNSKVFPARLIGKKKLTGGKVEIFLLTQCKHSANKNIWNVMIGGLKRKQDQIIQLDKGLEAKILKNNKDQTWQVEFNLSSKKMMQIVEQIGKIPLPPYIKEENQESKINKQNKSRYQTIYANTNKIGSVAAPTAGLHFTPRLIEKIKSKGINIVYITLHVGLGTFAPVKVDNIINHKMHAEYVEVSNNAIHAIKKAKKEKHKIIAVGTTSVRTLEAVYQKNKLFKPFKGFINIFIYPGFKFKVINSLITNFHLPKSTLVMLVSALAGKQNIKKVYQMAVNQKYKFFSYGDAMLID